MRGALVATAMVAEGEGRVDGVVIATRRRRVEGTGGAATADTGTRDATVANVMGHVTTVGMGKTVGVALARMGLAVVEAAGGKRKETRLKGDGRT